jgi:hypothetical protein
VTVIPKYLNSCHNFGFISYTVLQNGGSTLDYLLFTASLLCDWFYILWLWPCKDELECVNKYNIIHKKVKISLLQAMEAHRVARG